MKTKESLRILPPSEKDFTTFEAENIVFSQEVGGTVKLKIPKSSRICHQRRGWGGVLVKKIFSRSGTPQASNVRTPVSTRVFLMKGKTTSIFML